MSAGSPRKRRMSSGGLLVPADTPYGDSMTPWPRMCGVWSRVTCFRAPWISVLSPGQCGRWEILEVRMVNLWQLSPKVASVVARVVRVLVVTDTVVVSEHTRELSPPSGQAVALLRTKQRSSQSPTLLPWQDRPLGRW
jgi:hypothetical protein